MKVIVLKTTFKEKLYRTKQRQSLSLKEREYACVSLHNSQLQRKLHVNHIQLSRPGIGLKNNIYKESINVFPS